VYHCSQLSYTTQHWPVLTIFPLIIQTIIIAQMPSTAETLLGDRGTRVWTTCRYEAVLRWGINPATTWSQVWHHRLNKPSLGDCLQMRQPSQYFTKPHRLTQPPTLHGMANEYQPKCGDALWLGSKGRYGSFHMWINVRVAGLTVWSLVNMCQPWVLHTL